MKKVNRKILLSVVVTLLMAAVFAVAVFAAKAGTGYAVNDELAPTNIKWTMEENGVLTFEIDPAATDKVQTTELFGKDPITGTANSWDKNLPTFADAVKIVIGDGITAIAGFSALESLQQVELATSVTTIKGATFESDRALQSVYVRGTSPVAGTFDFSYVTSIGGYCCDATQKMTKLILNPNLAGELPAECFKNNGLTELEIPAGVTDIKDGAFMQTQKLQVITVLGMETTFASDAVFKSNRSYPAIKAKAGSKAAEFAKANGYTYIDLDTGETTKGTKLTTSASQGGFEGNTQGTTTPAVTDFKPEGATLWGHSSGKYNGGDIINTWWAYYDDTKTLEFVSATTKYNETGKLANVDEGYTDWSEYKNQIEHIIVGDNIDKISGAAFSGYKNLKDIRLGNKVAQIDAGAFTDCESLTTIWKNGTERIEGRADCSGIAKINNIFKGTNIKEIILPQSVKELAIDLPPSIQTIYVPQVTEALIEYVKENLFNLQSLTKPDDRYEYWVYVDPNLPACGGRAVFGFDEATGVLTVYGAGAIDDISNYYGGGSKKQPWFEIRDNVKHIVLGDNITSIGKYAFCEFKNLETVQIPASDNFVIYNAAFEKCYNLKSIYRNGDEPIEGTIDVRNVHVLNSWTFANDSLIANVIVSPEVAKIGSSVFDGNTNLANIYGTPGSYAEQFASENGYAFYDIASSVPQPIACTPIDFETTTGADSSDTDTTVVTETEVPTDVVDTESDSTDSSSVATDTKPTFVDDGEGTGSSSDGNSITMIIIVAVVVVVAVAAVVVLLVIKKKKKAQ